jgi:hypothetical protein
MNDPGQAARRTVRNALANTGVARCISSRVPIEMRA